MWEQYRKTFAKTQSVIAVVTIWTYFGLGHWITRSLVFFVVMQAAAVVGAMWGVRLRNKVDGKAF
jgi:uncharacterized membrane protein YfcA